MAFVYIIPHFDKLARFSRMDGDKYREGTSYQLLAAHHQQLVHDITDSGCVLDTIFTRS